MPNPRTHERIDRDLCGTPTEIRGDRAVVELRTIAVMAVDESGLVHGGFVFGLADHAAMLAIDEPTVVLASAECRFLAPVAVGERLVARAVVNENGERDPRRLIVGCIVESDESIVFEGTFRCAIPRRHVLEERGGER